MRLRAKLLLAAAMVLAGLGTTFVAAAPASAAPCTTSDSSFGGTFYCGYGKKFYAFSDGTYQIFVIGTDYSVWTRWRKNGNYSRWVDLGGEVRHTHAATDFYQLNCANQPNIAVVGTDNHWWVNSRFPTGAWSGWWKGDTVVCP